MDKKINRKELVAMMAERNGTTKIQATKELANVLGTILDATADGIEIQLLGEISTEIRDVAEREYPNPQGREKTITVPAHKKLVIKAGSKFQSAVNGVAYADED